MNFILLIIRYILLKLHLLGRSWPKYRDPLLSLVINISRNALKNGGLFILQSYYAGIDISNSLGFNASTTRVDRLRKLYLFAKAKIKKPKLEFISPTHPEFYPVVRSLNKT